MGKDTKIDWCDASWNPVTGCYHGCRYCYARGIAKRFRGFEPRENLDWDVYVTDDGYELAELYGTQARVCKSGKAMPAPYPFGFMPTLHRYEMDKPQEWMKSKTIFVCSMADLFGKWVPDSWIKEVFDACAEAPQHRYLFLTKNPSRYIELAKKGLLPREHWYGYTATRQNKLWSFEHADECPCENLFVSIEPIQEEMHPCFSTHTPADWVIIGAETGHAKGKVVPEKKWVDAIADECNYSGRPIFMKESLRELMGDDFKQEFPWDAPRF